MGGEREREREREGGRERDESRAYWAEERYKIDYLLKRKAQEVSGERGT